MIRTEVALSFVASSLARSHQSIPGNSSVGAYWTGKNSTFSKAVQLCEAPKRRLNPHYPWNVYWLPRTMMMMMMMLLDQEVQTNLNHEKLSPTISSADTHGSWRSGVHHFLLLLFAYTYYVLLAFPS